jgi:hypothetical protein
VGLKMDFPGFFFATPALSYRSVCPWSRLGELSRVEMAAMNDRPLLSHLVDPVIDLSSSSSLSVVVFARQPRTIQKVE